MDQGLGMALALTLVVEMQRMMMTTRMDVQRQLEKVAIKGRSQG